MHELICPARPPRPLRQAGEAGPACRCAPCAPRETPSVAVPGPPCARPQYPKECAVQRWSEGVSRRRHSSHTNAAGSLHVPDSVPLRIRGPPSDRRAESGLVPGRSAIRTSGGWSAESAFNQGGGAGRRRRGESVSPAQLPGQTPPRQALRSRGASQLILRLRSSGR